MKEIKTILADLATASAGVADLEKSIVNIEAHMQRLKKAGLEYARPHYREEKYLYLVSSMNQGQRERRYVGADPAKIAAAYASIERAKEYDELQRAAYELRAKVYEIDNLCRSVARTLEASKRVALKAQEKAPAHQAVAIPPGGGLQHRLDGGVDVVDAQCRVVKQDWEDKTLPDNLRRALLKKQIKKELAAQGMQEPFLTAQAVCRLKSEHGL